MGKRKNAKQGEVKRKKLKQEQDAQLSSGVFSGKLSDVENVSEGDWENEEQGYEMRPRVSTTKIVTEGLPIKNKDGSIQRIVREVKEAVEEDPEPEQDEDPQPEQQTKEDEEEEPESALSPREQLIKTKEEVADLASRLMEDPEENIQFLTRLRKMCESKNPITSQLAITALIPVFKSLAPGYRIRALSDAEKREKVSKDVAKLRTFEQGLVHNYQLYIEQLGKLARVSRSNSANNKSITLDQIMKGQLAAKAACELCDSSLRHFNFRAELFNIVIRRLNRKPTEDSDYEVFTRCLRVLETQLKEDEAHGDITFDIVRLLCKSVRDKKFRVDESVINVFLSLSLLEDYDPNNNKRDQKVHIQKKDRVHLSKKERKQRKERKEIEEEMRKAEQAVTEEERERYQSQVLKMLLTLYLEILKAGTHTLTTGKNDASLLMAAVLEGLAKFGQMANFDLLGDFLQVLREILTDIIDEHSLANDDTADDEHEGGMYTGEQFRTSLLCIATSFALILNHQSTGKIPIAIDLSTFIKSLYALLTDLALDTDIEFGHKSLRLADPQGEALQKPSVNVSTKAELLLRCLDCTFFRSKNGTLPRGAAFTKRLYMVLLHTPEKSSLALLKFVGKLTSRYGEGLKGLYNTEERISGEGLYVLGIERPNVEVELERANSGAATLWENVLLDQHYSPMVRDGSRSLMKNSKPNPNQK